MDNLTDMQKYTENRIMRRGLARYTKQAEETLHRVIMYVQTARDPYRAYDVMQAICSSLNVAEMAITEGKANHEHK